MDPVIPDKLYFKIGEVAELVNVEPYVLRYWETEFKEIAPIKSRSNQRLYRKKDLERVMQIKHLLYQEGFTIDGARRRLQEQDKPPVEQPPVRDEAGELLGTIRNELEGLLALVAN